MDWMPRIGLTAAALLWASSFIALKVAFSAYDPMVVIFGRMAIASICFLFFIGRFRRIHYRPGDLKWLAFMAFCEPCLYFIFEATALKNTSASQAGMITAMLPLMVAVAARRFLREPLPPRTVIGFVMAIAGTVWLSAGAVATHASPRPVLGNSLEFIAMVCAVGYMTTLKHLTRRYPPLFLTAFQAFAGSIFFFPLMFLPGATLPTAFAPGPALAVLYLGTFVTLGGYGLFNYGTSRVPASQASAFVNLIPLFSVILGWVVLKERFTPMQYIAGVLVFAGVWLSQSATRENQVRRRSGIAA